MDKQKEFNEVKEIVKNNCNRQGIAKYCPERIAEAIIDKGYGNKKQAIKEFADKLKQSLVNKYKSFNVLAPNSFLALPAIIVVIDEVEQELYDED